MPATKSLQLTFEGQVSDTENKEVIKRMVENQGYLMQFCFMADLHMC